MINSKYTFHRPNTTIPKKNVFFLRNIATQQQQKNSTKQWKINIILCVELSQTVM